jgi:hypothetical protein
MTQVHGPKNGDKVAYKGVEVLFAHGHTVKMASESMTYNNRLPQKAKILILHLIIINRRLVWLACSWATCDRDDFANKFSSGSLVTRD